MESVFSALEELTRGGGPSAIGKQLGIDESATRSAVSAALPTLIGALARNAQRPGGAASLQGALARDHDGSILGDLFGAVASPRSLDGEGILRHVLGMRRPAVESQIGAQSGLDPATVGKLLTMLAPLVMGALGRAQREQGMDERGLEDLLGRERRQFETARPGGLGPLESILDSDGDGDIKDDVVRIGGGFLRRFFSGRR